MRAIGDCAFTRCESLENVVLPAILNAIGEKAFLRCKSLRTIKSCGDVQMIGEEAFNGCDLLDHVHTPSKALVVITTENKLFYQFVLLQAEPSLAQQLRRWRLVRTFEARENYYFRFVTDGTLRRTNHKQVVIASDCFNSMNAAMIAEVELVVARILGTARDWGDRHRRLRAMLAPYER